MKPLMLSILFLSAVGWASPILLDPISISGSGTWGWDYEVGTFENITAFGSDGQHNISLSFETGNDYPLFLPLAGFYEMNPCFTSGTVSVDGIIAATRCSIIQNTFSFSSDGVLCMYNANDPILLVTLQGYLNITDYSELYWEGRLVSARATFMISPQQIIPIPEPKYMWFICLLASAAIFSRITRSARSRSST